MRNLVLSLVHFCHLMKLNFSHKWKVILIENIDIYNPRHIGKNDILICFVTNDKQVQ